MTPSTPVCGPEEGFYVADDDTGFGLSIVAQIAAAHGGSANVTESEAGGARFEIRGLETR